MAQTKNPADIAINRAVRVDDVSKTYRRRLHEVKARPALPLAIATSCLTPLSFVSLARFKAGAFAADVIRGITLANAVNPVAYDNPVDNSEIGDRAPDVEAMLPYWDLTDDIVAGLEAMMLRGKTYMPMFPEESTRDYEFRLSLAKMTNIYRDTVEGLASKPFQEEVSLATGEKKVVPEAISEFIEDVDGSGVNLTEFASAQFFNSINSAVSMIFVDMPKRDPNIRTLADAKAAGVRPYWSHIMARNVLKAKSKIIGKKERWTELNIFEPGEPKNRIRVMKDNGTIATWQLFEETDAPIGKKKNYILIDEGTFEIGEIPVVMFATGRRDGKRFFFRPPMRDSADLQKTLYKNESGLEYAKTMGAFSMLAGQGVSPPKQADGKTPEKLTVGPQTVLYAPQNASSGEAGRWEFIGPDAAILQFLAAEIKDTQQQLRELGRQPLTAQSGNLTTVTAATAANKSRSAVSAWANGLKNALENALVLTCQWMNISQAEYDPEVNVYKEFDNFTDAAGDTATLRTMRDKGDLSQETYWYENKRRGVLSPEFDAKEEGKRLALELPSDEEYDESGNVIPSPTKLKVVK